MIPLCHNIRWVLKTAVVTIWVSIVTPTMSHAVSGLNSPPEISADISSTSGVVGQRFEANLRIIAENVKATEVLSLADLSTTWTQIGELTVEDSKNGENEIRSVSAVFVPFEIGKFEAPSFSVTWLNSNGTSETQIVKLPVITINSVLDRKTTQSLQLKNIKPPVPLKFPKAVVAGFWSLVVVLLVGLIAFLFRCFFRKSMFMFQAKPPHLEALQLIEEIQRENLIEHKKYKEFYTRLSMVIRAYIHKAYHIDTEEMTSHELLENLQSKRDDESASHKARVDEAVENLSKLLHDSDLVKFAKAVPNHAMSNNAIKMASDIIKLTSYKFDDDKISEESDNANG